HSGSTSFQYELQQNEFQKFQYVKGYGLKTFQPGLKNLSITKTVFAGEHLFVIDGDSYKRDFSGVQILNSDNSLKTVFPYLEHLQVSSMHSLDAKTFLFGHRKSLLFGSHEKLLRSKEVSIVPKDHRILKIMPSVQQSGIYFLIARDENGFKRLYRYNDCTDQGEDMIEELGINTTISDAYIDFEGNLWIATFGDGVYCYNYNTPLPKQLLNGNYVVDMVQKTDGIYVLTPSKLFHFTNKQSLETHELDGFAKKMVLSGDTLFISVLNGNKAQSFDQVRIVDGRFYGISDWGRVKQSDTLSVGGKPIHVGNEMVVNALESTKNGVEFYTTKGKWNYHIADGTFAMDSLFQFPQKTNRFHGFAIKNDSIFYLTDRGLFIRNKGELFAFGKSHGLFNESVN
ncbi:MAG: hypothetical protein AAFP96_08660, partial [Bacteroidota bacterium]